jgi:hypothetical protein
MTGAPAYVSEPLSEFNAGHGTELNVEDKAAELQMLRVR